MKTRIQFLIGLFALLQCMTVNAQRIRYVSEQEAYELIHEMLANYNANYYTITPTKEERELYPLSSFHFFVDAEPEKNWEHKCFVCSVPNSIKENELLTADIKEYMLPPDVATKPYVLNNVFGLVSVTANVNSYGELANAIGDDWSTTEALTVTGPIDDSDFAIIRKCANEGKLMSVDLSNAELKDNTLPSMAFWECKSIMKVILPEGIRKIGSSAFCFSGVREVNLPESIEELAYDAFRSCYYLQGSPLVLPKKLTEIPTSCFMNCYGITEFVFPEDIKKIDDFAFRNTGMRTLNLPEGVEEIGASAFSDNFFINEIRLPESITTIGEWAFNNNIGLFEITLPKNITTIPNDFLAECLQMESITLTESVNEICKAAFANCHSMKSIVSMSSIPPVCTFDKEHPFKAINANIPVYVPIGTADLYRTSRGWDYFSNYIETSDFTSGINGITNTAPRFSDSIFSINGQTTTNRNSTGIYIVNRNNRNIKVSSGNTNQK